MRPTTVALAVLMLGLAVTGCSGDTSGTDGEDETVRVTMRGARIHTDSGAGLTVMLVSYPDVIVGSVTGIEDISDLKAFGYPVERASPSKASPHGFRIVQAWTSRRTPESPFGSSRRSPAISRQATRFT